MSHVTITLCRAVLVLLLSTSTAFCSDILIENASLITVEPARVSGVRHVLIRDGRIAAVSDKPIAAAANIPRLNARGKFLTPGLMDSHVHVSDAEGIPHGTDDIDLAALRAEYFRQQPRSYLYFGVPTRNSLARLDPAIVNGALQ